MKKYDEIIQLFEQTRDNADDLVNFLRNSKKKKKKQRMKALLDGENILKKSQIKEVSIFVQ